jgi:hypothetical protein
VASFTPDTFADGVVGNTPITAAKLNNAEQQYADAMADTAALYGQDVKQIFPSGDTTGATDLAAINASPNAMLTPGATYYVNGPIVRPSYSCLRARGATIHLVTGGSNIIRNAAAAASRSVSDAVTTANSTTVTSATGAFTSADVGAMVGVIGAALGGATWYGKIVTVNSATSITLNWPADLALTGATLQVFANRDTNIDIEGGTWILDVAPADGHQTTSTAFNSFASAFRRVSGLRLRDTTWSTPGLTGQGGKFTVSLADVDDFIVSGTHFIQTAGDGIHVMGPGSNGIIRDTTGTTGDDMVVISCGDQNTPYITDTQGPLSSILTQGIVATGSWSAYKLYDLGTAKRFTVTGCRVDDISGSTQQQAVSIISPFSDAIEISRVAVQVGGSNPVVNLSNNAYATSTTVRDIQWSNTVAPSSGVVKVTQGRNSVKIENITFATAPSGTNVAVYLTSSLSGSTFGLTTLDIDGVYAPMQVGGSQVTFATFHVVNCDATGSGDSAITIRNVSVQATAGYMVNKTAVCPISRIEIADSTFKGSGLISTPSGDSNTSLVLANTRATVTNLAVIKSPLDAQITGVRSVSSGPAFSLVGSGATPVRLRVGTYHEAGTGGGVTRDGTQAVSVNGHTLPVDVSILTATDGDIANNSNAALGCGVGPAVYNATAAKWKGLYSGATN